MITYLINSLLCGLILYLAYILLLENENIHKFKRGYLLFSLIFSLVIPLIPLNITASPTTETPKQTTVVFAELNEIRYAVNESIEQTTTVLSDNLSNDTHINFPIIAGMVYWLVAVALLFRFLLNILFITRQKRQGIALSNQGTNIILMKEKITPHSFGKYIFINREDYENKQIANEIITHESLHIRQCHFLDIIFMELLIIFFWFNPMLYLYRNKIKLNHEFLADKAVIRKNNNVPYYQTLLIGMACRQRSSIITSRLNFLLTKKRFIMMTKTTSKKKICCRTLALIPVFLAAIAFFSTKITAQNNVSTPNGCIEGVDNQCGKRDATFAARYKEYNQIFENYIIKEGERKTGTTAGIGGKTYNLGAITKEDLSRLKELFLSMTPEQQNTLTFIFRRMEVPAKKVPTKKEFESWKSPTNYGIWLDGKKIENSALNRYKPSDFSLFYVSKLEKNAKDYGKYIYHLELTTTKHYEERKKKEETDKTLYLSPNSKKGIDYLPK